jgi:hypothetical protein
MFTKANPYIRQKDPNRYVSSKCIQCGKDIESRKRKPQRFCSKQCYWQGKVGTKVNNGVAISAGLKGKPKSPEHIAKVAIALTGKIRENIRGEKHYKWKGDHVGYAGIHNWIKKIRGKRPPECQFCTKVGKMNKLGWSIHWCNKSGEYKRDESDWLTLCISCHRKYDHQLRVERSVPSLINRKFSK